VFWRTRLQVLYHALDYGFMVACTLGKLAVGMTAGGNSGRAVPESREPEAEEMKPQRYESLDGNGMRLPDWRRKPPELSSMQRGSIEPRSAGTFRQRDLDRPTLRVYL